MMTPDEIERSFADRVRELRFSSLMSQVELAERLERYGIKLDGTAITRIERGTRSVKLAEAVALAHALGSTVDGMLARQGSIDDQIAEAQMSARIAEDSLARARVDAQWAHERLAELEALKEKTRIITKAARDKLAADLKEKYENGASIRSVEE